MGQYSKRVDVYIAERKDFAKPILIHLRKLVHQASPEFTESINGAARFLNTTGLFARWRQAGYNFNTAETALELNLRIVTESITQNKPSQDT